MPVKIVKDRPVIKTAQEMVSLLRLRYPSNAYAFLEQVGNSTGFRCNRHCDALVMSLWPSRGLEIIGIEVKVARSDWLKELATPEKADAIAQYCDRWYLAVGDANIVQDGELPKNWGLIVPKADGSLYVKTEAKLSEPEPEPDRSFLAAVLRQVQLQLTDEARLNTEYQRGHREGTKEAEARDWYKTDLEALKKKVSAFEKASGVQLNLGWNKPEKVGEAVRRVLDGADTHLKERLEKLHSDALQIAQRIEEQLASSR